MTESDSTDSSTGTRGKMQRWINQLIQLQDLIFARDQQQVSAAGARLSSLETSIQTLEKELPIEVQTHFVRLHNKGGLAIVPIANGVCSACGMAIPVSQVHAVHAADKLYHCPSCARFLFYQGTAPRRLSKQRLRSEPAQVGLARFSSPQLMIPHLAGAEMEEVIAELSGRMESEGFVDNAALLTEEALKREAITSTGVDQGLAFPHVRGVEGGGLTLALGVSRKGVRFGDNKTLSRLIFFMVIPTAASAFYLRLLSGLTKSFREEESRDALFKAETPEDLWKALIKTTRATIS
ncbi:MAG: PTS sugar transporter subunit IIA [Kiritimatiellae bacterium]|nr:PTS sugar transporter subunit IIA [Kiritimatiellia bacterium]